MAKKPKSTIIEEEVKEVVGILLRGGMVPALVDGTKGMLSTT